MTTHILSVTEIAELLVVNKGTVCNWVKRGLLIPDYVSGMGTPFWENNPDKIMHWYLTERHSCLSH